MWWSKKKECPEMEKFLKDSIDIEKYQVGDVITYLGIDMTVTGVTKTSPKYMRGLLMLSGNVSLTCNYVNKNGEICGIRLYLSDLELVSKKDTISTTEFLITRSELLTAIDDYWDIGYSEGKSGATTDNIYGDAQKARHKIVVEVDKLISKIMG